jgi:CRISPR/Cas system CSM-associated protein Csm3 (group 7 of RAMP superfamily)
MLKATFLEGTLSLTIVPNGPILVKAGESASADPTLPDMEFVRTRRGGKQQIYIPGSSLKGVVRAQCERICRSLDRDGRDPNRDDPPLADNPLGRGASYEGLSDMSFSSGAYFNSLKTTKTYDELSPSQQTALIYRRSSFVSQLFGNTSLAGRVRFADAYSDDIQPEDIEERNGVAIDRIYGSVAVGPFNYETVVAGTFQTKIDFKNLTLAQLGLLGLGLRDLAEGRVGLGFGKSRGLGRVKVTFDALMCYYPTCEFGAEHALQRLGARPVAQAWQLAGIGAFCGDAAYADYHLAKDDIARLPGEPNYVEQPWRSDRDTTAGLPEGITFRPDDLLGVRLIASGDAQVRAIWRACMDAWKREIGL